VRLMHPYLQEPLSITDDKVQVLVIENQLLFTKLVSELVFQIEGVGETFVLSMNYEPIELKSEMEVIIDYFHLSGTQKRIQTKLNNLFRQLAQQELQFETVRIFEDLCSYYQKLSENIEFSITYKVSNDVSPLLKMGDIQISLEGETLAEKLLDYMTICSRLCGISCFSLINLKRFISMNELELLYKSAIGKKLRLLLVENTYQAGLERYENTLLLDNDMCELRVEVE
jgi:CRISPR-associated protein Csn2